MFFVHHFLCCFFTVFLHVVSSLFLHCIFNTTFFEQKFEFIVLFPHNMVAVHVLWYSTDRLFCVGDALIRQLNKDLFSNVLH